MKKKSKLTMGILLVLVASFLIFLAFKQDNIFNNAMQSDDTSSAINVGYSNLENTVTILPTKQVESGNLSSLKTDEIRVHFIDVGQGDCVLIESGLGDYMLIDVGPVEAEDKLKSYLDHLGVKSFVYVVGTHPHDDHIGNLGMIINNYDVAELWMPDVERNHLAYYGAIEAAQENLVPLVHPIAGSNYVFAGGTIEVLAPNSNTYDDMNDYSIVIRYTYGERSFLFSGDAEAYSESEILEAEYQLSSDVLKVAHHGSSSSSSEKYIEAIQPKIAIISCGVGNDSGHPHDEILARLSYGEYPIDGLYRTDLDGDINIVTDGFSLEIEVTTNNQALKASHMGIEIEIIDKQDEYVIIHNSLDTSMDLSDWVIYSEKGHQSIHIPTGVFLEPDGRYIIGGYRSLDQVDLVWEDGDGIWSNSKEDDGILYDSQGNLIDAYMDSYID